MAASHTQHPNGARVAVREGRLWFNGRGLTPFGGELQYFRVRDPGGDARRTQALWAETMDRMVEAGLNLVTTYVPWDWHEGREGAFDFGGDRDLGAFLGMAHARGLVAAVKPGPFITAEWPRGFGSFGAVPAWFKRKHRHTLVRRPGGRAWSFDPLGDPAQAQPAYHHPEFLAAVRRWFAALAPTLRRFIHDTPTIAILQLDNETNLWWSGLDHVDIPGGYEERQQYCCDYLARLRAMWRELGVAEPDVLVTVNDSPFPIPGRQTLLHDGPRKNRVALAALDTYPRGLPAGARAADQPFQAPYFARLWEHHTGGFAYAAEIQAMDLQLLLGLRARCDPRATGALLAHLFGSGVRGGALYVIREGLNADGTLYGPAAPLSLHGDATARWEEVKRWGALLGRHGAELAGAAAEARGLAVVTHRAHAADAEERGRLWALEGAGMFGWLRMAGYDADALDLEGAEVGGYRGLAAIRADLLPAAARAKLDAAAEAGATVVLFADGGGARPWGAILPGAEDGLFPYPAATGVSTLPRAAGPLRLVRERRELAAGGAVFLRGPAGEPLAAIEPRGRGRIVRFACRFTSEYNLPSFYDLSDAELRQRRDLARALFAPVEPPVEADAPRVEAWRRGRFVFAVNHGPAARVRLAGAARGRDGVTGEPLDPGCVELPEMGWRVLCEGGGEGRAGQMEGL